MDFSSLDRLLQASVPLVAPALVCRVEQGGALLYERGLGVINPMLKHSAVGSPVAADTIFDLASLTKLFTATACLRMIDAGQLDLDGPIGAVLPAFNGLRAIGPTEDPITKAPAPILPAWRDHTAPIDLAQVTLRRLLTHSSGLPAWRNLYALCGDPPKTGSQAELSRADLLHRRSIAAAAIAGFDFAYPPGAAISYSDLGFILLGELLTTRAGDALLDDTLTRWVAEPLGLGVHYRPTPLEIETIAPTEFCAWRNRRLHGEVHDENAAGLDGIAGHAGLFGTAADLTRLGNLYLEGGKGLLKPETVAAAIAPQLITAQADQPLSPPTDGTNGIRRGLGWMLRSGPEPSCSLAFGPRSFGHTGFTGGSLWCDPDRELVVALLTNRVYHGRAPEAITRLRPAVHATVHTAVIDALTAP